MVRKLTGGRKMDSLKNKTVVITGAGNDRGIGYAVALALVRAGAEKAFLLDLHQRIISRDKFTCWTHDVTDFDSVLRISKKIHENCGAIDILVNCAAILELPKDMNDYAGKKGMETMMSMFNVNVVGACNWYCAVIPGMIERNEGCIINITSIAGGRGRPGNSIYEATKAALTSFTLSWAQELESKAPNVRVNAVAPGFVKTEMTDKLGAKARKRTLQDVVPSHRTTEAKEIADVVLSVVRCSALNGTVIAATSGKQKIITK